MNELDGLIKKIFNRNKINIYCTACGEYQPLMIHLNDLMCKKCKLVIASISCEEINV